MNYKQNGKGFYLVDLDSDIPEVDPITMELPREIVKAQISEDSIAEQIQNLKERITLLKSKPLIYLDIHSSGLKIDNIYAKIQKEIADLSLTVRPNFFIKTDDEREKSVYESIPIKEFIREYCRSRKDLQIISNQFIDSDFFVDKVVQLYEALVADDTNAALTILEKFYEGLK